MDPAEGDRPEHDRRRRGGFRVLVSRQPRSEVVGVGPVLPTLSHWLVLVLASDSDDRSLGPDRRTHLPLDYLLLRCPLQSVTRSG